MKIFHLVTTIHAGGSENVAISLAEGFSKNSQAECEIIEIYKTSGTYTVNIKKKLKETGIRYYSLGSFQKRVSLMVAPFVLIYYIAKKKPDIIHAHTDLPDFVLSVALRLNRDIGKKAKIVRTIHNTKLWYTHNLIGRFVEQMFVQDKIAAVSNAALEAYKELRKNNNLEVSTKNAVIYNGCLPPQKLPHKFKINPNKINVAFCGRLVYQKGIDILVSIIGSVTSKHPDQFLFHIVGDGEDKHLIDALANKLSNVLIYGEVPQMSAKLYPFDFLLMPSRFEGLPLITIESSLSKLPVIASNVAGLEETLPNNWPLLFDINNPTTEALSLFDQIVNESFNETELQNQAFDFARSRFSLIKMLDSYHELYFS